MVACTGEYKIPIGREIVSIDQEYFRPTEVELLLGDATKAKKALGWEPKYDLHYLVKDMMAADLSYFKKEKLMHDNGHGTLKRYE